MPLGAPLREEILAAHPEHELAPSAARQTHQLLLRTGKAEVAEALEPGWNAERKVNELTTESTVVMNALIYHALFLQLVDEQPDYEDGPPSFEPRLADDGKRDEIGTPDMVLLLSEELAVFDGAADRRVADVGQVRNLGALPDDGLLDLDERACLGATLELGTGAQVGNGFTDQAAAQG